MTDKQQVDVLLVDDEPGILDFLGEVLREEGYTVSTAPNGAEALKVLETMRPRLVLLDLMMPVMDGRTFALRMRANPETMDIPIVVFSAYRELRDQAVEIGAEGILAKPFELDEALNFVERFAGAPQRR